MNLSKNDILKINDIVYDAGKAILDIYDTSFNVETKSDNSPLTQADKNSHSVIDSGLKSLFPNITNIQTRLVLSFYFLLVRK